MKNTKMEFMVALIFLFIFGIVFVGKLEIIGLIVLAFIYVVSIILKLEEKLKNQQSEIDELKEKMRCINEEE